MKFNHVDDTLKFAGSSITHLLINNESVNLGTGEASFAMDLAVHEVSTGDDGLLSGYITLQIESASVAPVSASKNTASSSPVFHLEYESEGLFMATSPMKETDFVGMLYINGGAMLYSIARADILNITSSVFSQGKLRIPVVNILEFLEEKQKAESKTAEE